MNDIKTKYQYIHFVKIADKPKTSVWSCRNNESYIELGKIKWNPKWRQYCYFTDDIPTVYSIGCLNDINDFITQLKEASKDE